MSARVKTEHITRTRNIIKGWFKLTDGSTTKFDIDREQGWNQWGNVEQNLWITVPRLEELQEELLDL